MAVINVQPSELKKERAVLRNRERAAVARVSAALDGCKNPHETEVLSELRLLKDEFRIHLHAAVIIANELLPRPEKLNWASPEIYMRVIEGAANAVAKIGQVEQRVRRLAALATAANR
jgi:hypothetical protein